MTQIVIHNSAEEILAAFFGIEDIYQLRDDEIDVVFALRELKKIGLHSFVDSNGYMHLWTADTTEAEDIVDMFGAVLSEWILGKCL